MKFRLQVDFRPTANKAFEHGAHPIDQHNDILDRLVEVQHLLLFHYI